MPALCGVFLGNDLGNRLPMLLTKLIGSPLKNCQGLQNQVLQELSLVTPPLVLIYKLIALQDLENSKGFLLGDVLVFKQNILAVIEQEFAFSEKKLDSCEAILKILRAGYSQRRKLSLNRSMLGTSGKFGQLGLSIVLEWISWFCLIEQRVVDVVVPDLDL